MLLSLERFGKLTRVPGGWHLGYSSRHLALLVNKGLFSSYLNLLKAPFGFWGTEVGPSEFFPQVCSTLGRQIRD